MKKQSVFKFVALIVLFSLALSACAPAAAPTAVTVQQTVVVEKTVVVQQTSVVEKLITATPVPPKPAEPPTPPAAAAD